MSLLRNFAAAVLAIGLASPSLSAEENVVAFAQVAALDGQAGAIGKGMRDGILAAFEEANRAGGIHGRLLRLDSFDDGYEPDRAMDHFRNVIAEDSYIAVVGPVGTPTAKVTQPLATAAGLPFVGAFTGAGFLRDPDLTNVINIRATYADETEAWIAHLVDELGLQEIALLYQDDSFGLVGLNGVTAALAKRDLELVATGTYLRNTTAVKSALLDIRKAKPQAVVMAGTHLSVAEFIRLAHSLEFRPRFVNLSVSSRALAQKLGAEGEGVIVSQVVPSPWDTSLPVVAQYQQAMGAILDAAEPGFVTLEGYLVGRVALRALEAAGPGADRQAYLEALGGLGQFDLGGLTFRFGEDDNQGLDAVFLTRISKGGFEPVARARTEASR